MADRDDPQDDFCAICMCLHFEPIFDFPNCTHASRFCLKCIVRTKDAARDEQTQTAVDELVSGHFPCPLCRARIPNIHPLEVDPEKMQKVIKRHPEAFQQQQQDQFSRTIKLVFGNTGNLAHRSDRKSRWAAFVKIADAENDEPLDATKYLLQASFQFQGGSLLPSARRRAGVALPHAQFEDTPFCILRWGRATEWLRITVEFQPEFAARVGLSPTVELFHQVSFAAGQKRIFERMMPRAEAPPRSPTQRDQIRRLHSGLPTLPSPAHQRPRCEAEEIAALFF